MTPRTALLRTLAATALLAAGAAHADRPLVSETADVIGAGDCQVEAWAGRARQSGSASVRDGTVFTSCGVAGVHQFGVALSQERAAGQRNSGATLFGKTTVRMPDMGQTGFGVAYTLGFDKPSGQGLRRESAAVLGVLTQPLPGDVLLHANLGWAHSRAAGQSTTNWSLGVERVDDFSWAADVYGDDRSRPWVSAGAGWALLEKLSFNASYALQFERKKVRQISVGVKMQF